MELSIERIELLLLIAAVVSMAARALHLPYTVGLVLTGVGLAFFEINPNIELTKELVFTALLPPLIFEAAFQMRWRELRRDLLVTLTLATLGVIISVGVIAVGISYFIGWELRPAILLAVLISATDPVSVIATFKEAGVEGRLRLLVESESLFNDGAVAVLFGVTLSAMTFGASVDPWAIGQGFAFTILGGMACGALVGGGIMSLSIATQDHLVEITFTSIAAYGSFLLAEHFHLSGVMATLVSGVLLGNVGSAWAISDRGREAVETFWEYVAFVANSLIFLLIGFRLTEQSFGEFWRAAVIVNLLVLAGRAMAVYGCCALFSRSARRVEAKHQHVLFWGGLRGALALALVLGLPLDMPHRQAILTITFAVVAFSVIIQGLTITLWLRGMSEISPRPE